MTKQNKSRTVVRRSVALPRDLLREVQASADPELRSNVNRLVIVALQEFVNNRKRRKFEQAMAEMANDPEIRAQTQQITSEFMSAESDGLPRCE